MTITETQQLLDMVIRPAISSLARNSSYIRGRGIVDEELIKSVIEANITERPVINCVNGLRGSSISISCPDIGNLFAINSYKNADNVWIVTELDLNHNLENIPRENRGYFEDAVILIEHVVYNMTGHDAYIFKYKDTWYLKYNNILYLCPNIHGSYVTFFLNDETMMFEIDAKKTDVIDGMRIVPPRNRGSPKTSW